jgi:hypothetical protein
MRAVWQTITRTVTKIKIASFIAALTASLLLPALANPIIAHAGGINNTRGDAWGTLEVSGTDANNLGGSGVNIYSNGSQVSYTPNKPNNTVNGIVSGEEWQCVELVNRLYLTKAWTTATWSGNGGQLYDNAPASLYKELNGAITYLNPGDTLVLQDSGAGHAAIINTYNGSTGAIQIESQNTDVVYDSTFSLSNKTISSTGWGTYSIKGVVHHPNPTNSRPVSVNRGSGNMDVFYRDTGGNLKNIGWNSSTGWGSATNKASGVSSNPTAVARTTSSMDVFYRDTSNNLQNVGWTSSGGWGSAVGRVTDGSVNGDPFVVARDSNHMDVFYKDSSNELMDVQWDSTNGWYSPLIISGTYGTVGGSPTAIVRDSNDFDVFYRSTTNNLEDVGYGSGAWSGPTARVTGTATGDFTAISRTSSSMDVFYQTTSGGLGNASWNSTYGWGGTTWSGTAVVVSSGASFVGTPKAINRDDGNMSVFYQDSYGNLVEKSWNWQTGWAAPYNRAHNIADNPAAVTRDSGDMDVFFRDGGGNLNDEGWNSTTGWGESKPGAGSMA